MSFENGSVSCRSFFVPRDLPDDALDRFAEHAAPGLAALREEPIQGWVGGRHLLDLVITEENAYFAGHLRLSLMQAERKIPPALLKAEQAMEELAQLQATGKAYLNRKDRSEIKRQVVERLLPTMPPQLKGIPFVYSQRSQMIYAGCLSEKQLDAFQIHFARTLGFALIPAMPADVALRRQVDVEALSPTSFSPDMTDQEVHHIVGEDFLTWLWYISENEQGALHIEGTGQITILIEGPLTFHMEGNGAHLTVLRKGEPLISAEAKSALLAGKKLRQAILNLVHGEETWSCTLDADQFVFRGMKLPKPEDKMDAQSLFQERVQGLDRFMELFFALYYEFLARRSRPEEWADEVQRIRKWVSDRRTA